MCHLSNLHQSWYCTSLGPQCELDQMNSSWDMWTTDRQTDRQWCLAILVRCLTSYVSSIWNVLLCKATTTVSLILEKAQWHNDSEVKRPFAMISKETDWCLFTITDVLKKYELPFIKKKKINKTNKHLYNVWVCSVMTRSCVSQPLLLLQLLTVSNPECTWLFHDASPWNSSTSQL